MTASGRVHFRPLRYWEGERVQYVPGRSGPIVDQVVHMPPQEKKPKRTFNRKRQTAYPPTPPREEEEDLVTGLDADTKSMNIVKAYNEDKEVRRGEYRGVTVGFLC